MRDRHRFLREVGKLTVSLAKRKSPLGGEEENQKKLSPYLNLSV